MVSMKETRDYLMELFFVPNKVNGLREGFRRLAVIVGIIGAYITFDLYSQFAQVFVDFFGGAENLGMAAGLLYVFVAVFAMVTFFVVAGAVKLVGWVIEGFVK